MSKKKMTQEQGINILCERTHMYDFLSKVKMKSFIGQNT